MYLSEALFLSISFAIRKYFRSRNFFLKKRHDKKLDRFHKECLKNENPRTVIIIIINLIVSNEREREREKERKIEMNEPEIKGRGLKIIL